MRTIFLIFLFVQQLAFASPPAERLYIHFDRTEFRAGDTVHFKAYVWFNGLPSTRSTHFYIQIFNEKGIAVATGHFPILGATVDGGFNLPDSISTGNYYIQAFTPLMLSAASDVYVKNIWVDGSGFRSAKRPFGKLTQLHFFPEDGWLHADLLNMVVFRSTDAWGNPVPVKGTIQTADGQTVAPFQTLLPGLGLVRFKPRAGVEYRAVADSGGGSYALPSVTAGAIQLQIESERSGKKFQLARNPKVKLTNDAFRLTATIHDQIVYDQEISFGSYPSLVGHLLTDSLPSGILLFELFDGDGKLLLKRPCFNDRREWMAPAQLQRMPVAAEHADSVRMDLLLSDSVMSSVSLSVMNADRDFPDESMLTRLMLLNDWSFVPSDISSFLDPINWNPGLIDWLLIASPQNAAAIAKPIMFIPHALSSFLSMKGTVYDARSNERMSAGDLTVILETASGSSKQWTLTTNERGEFSIDSIVYAGMGSFYAYYADKKGKVRSVRVESRIEGLDSISPQLLSTTIARAGRQQPITARFNESLVGEPKAKTLSPLNLDRSSRSAEDEVNEKYTTGVFREPGKVTIDNVNNPVNDKSINVIDFIKNRIQQVEIQGGRFVNRKNMSLSTGQKWLVGLFLNEQPVDMNLLRTIRAMDVALIKFYEAGFVGSGSNYPGGAVAIYLRDKQEEGRPKDLPFYKGVGFTEIPSAGKAVYGEEERMLFWDPTRVLDQMRTRLSIYLPEKISTYRLVLSGFDVQGRLIWIQQEYKK